MGFTDGTITVISDNDKTSSSTWTTTAADGNASVGQLVVLILSTDNIDNDSGNTNSHLIASDDSNNIWVKKYEYTYDGGSDAGFGATVSVWTSILDKSIIAGTTLFTFTFSSAVTAKAVNSRNFDISEGYIFTEGYVTNGVGADPVPLTLSPLDQNIEYLFVRAIAREGTAITQTQTTNYTNFLNTGGTYNTSGGGTDTNIGAYGEFYVTNANSETSDPTHSVVGDSASIFIAFSIIRDEIVEWFRLSNDTDNGEILDSGDTYIEFNSIDAVHGTDTILRVADNGGALTTERILIYFRCPKPLTTGAKENITNMHLYLLNEGSGSTSTASRLAVMEINKSFLEGYSGEFGASGRTFDGYTNWTGDEIVQAWSINQTDEDLTEDWIQFPMTQYVGSKGTSSGGVVNIMIKFNDETLTSTEIYTYRSRQSPTVLSAGEWPIGSPEDWINKRARPVVRIHFEDEPPTAITEFKAIPYEGNPSFISFEWKENGDEDFSRYMIRYTTAETEKVIGTHEPLSLMGYLTRGITSSDITSAVLDDITAFPENTNVKFRIFVEDQTHKISSSIGGSEIVVVRPNVETVPITGGVFTPRIFNYLDLTSTFFEVQEEVVVGAAGNGEVISGVACGNKLNMKILVDWGDGTKPENFVPFVTKLSNSEASSQTVLSVDDISGFDVDDVVLIYDPVGNTNDIGRIIEVDTQTITIDTDQSGFSNGLTNSMPTGALIYTLPTHIYTKASSYTPRVKLLNATGFASDWTNTENTAVVDVLNPTAILTSNVQKAYDSTVSPAIDADTIHFSGSDSYPRMSDKPITLWNFTGTAATHDGTPVDGSGQIVPYYDHVHDTTTYPNETTCTFELTVEDEDANTSAVASVSIDIVARTILDLFNDLTDGYTTRALSTSPQTVISEGIDVREFFIIGDGKRTLRVSYSGTAVTDSDADTIPDDLETLIQAYNGKYIIIDTLPTGSTTGTYVGHLVDRINFTQIAPNKYSWSINVVYEAYKD